MSNHLGLNPTRQDHLDCFLLGILCVDPCAPAPRVLTGLTWMLRDPAWAPKLATSEAERGKSRKAHSYFSYKGNEPGEMSQGTADGQSWCQAGGCFMCGQQGCDCEGEEQEDFYVIEVTRLASHKMVSSTHRLLFTGCSKRPPAASKFNLEWSKIWVRF